MSQDKSQLACSAGVLKLVPMFDGTTSFASWWRRYEMACEEQSISCPVMKRLYKFALSPQIFEELQVPEAEARGLLLRRKQAGSESLHRLATDIFKLSMPAGCSLESWWLVTVFLKAMSDIDLSSRILDKNLKDVRDAVEIVKTISSKRETDPIDYLRQDLKEPKLTVRSLLPKERPTCYNY
ncbi:hypothetical protein RF11_01082 [Thelohanellus kitauei]|uniref:Uncharacterized protein n=1 Tax=Thelohanellus kitauei TaxID=669202 RepID=A0A0C2N4B3_THEKT|nr:hypothetical protein RF11_01082 [Thelohanellus kitauei]